MAKSKCPECIQNIPEYMLTYGDMVTLLLCFFYHALYYWKNECDRNADHPFRV